MEEVVKRSDEDIKKYITSVNPSFIVILQPQMITASQTPIIINIIIKDYN